MKQLPKSKHNPKTGIYKGVYGVEVAVINNGVNCSLWFVYLN